MAKNCTDIKDARRRIKKIMDDASSAASKEEAVGILLRGYHNLALDASAKLYPEIIDLIKVLAKKAGVLAIVGDPSTVFSDKVDINRVVADAEEKIRNLARYEETISRKGQVKKSFLKSLYGENALSQEYFLRSVKNGFGFVPHSSESMPGIPGLIDTFLANRQNGTLVRPQDIAENVRITKQELLNKVVQHLLSRGLLDNIDLELVSTILFNENGEYLDILNPSNSKLFEAIDAAFNPKVIAVGNYLDQLYSDYKKGNQKAREELEAYNAWVLLNNFDTVLTLVLDDTVIITKPENFNKISNTDYKTNIDKATNMWSFGFGDDVSDVGDLISNVTKTLIESSRRYTWRGPAIDDAYIGFKDFNYIIGKIKSLAFTLLSNDIPLDLDAVAYDEDQNAYSPFEKLSPTTKAVIERIRQINLEYGETSFNGVPTLGQVVAFMSENPTRHLHAIFDILCNTDLIDSGVLQFQDQEKNLIWSLYLELFGTHGNNSRSLFDLHHNTKGDTIFPIITLIADSMFAEDIIQYYEDENGVLYAQLMRDYAVTQIRNELALQILQTNGYFDSRGFDTSLFDPESAEYQLSVKNGVKKSKSFADIYKVKIEYTNEVPVKTPKGGIWKENGLEVAVKMLKSITIPIVVDGKNLAKIIATPGKATIVVDNNSAKEVWKSAEFKLLIADAIGIDFELDVDLLAAYESTFPGENIDGINYIDLLNDISSIVGIAVFNQEFNNQLVPSILTNTGRKRIQSNLGALAHTLFSEFVHTPRIDPKTGIISIVPEFYKNLLLDKLGLAKAIANNVFSSALVKTGEGTALSAFCLSRLRNSYPYQLVTQNRAKWSATNFMTFVRNQNGLFRGVASSREMKSKTTVKTSTEMSGVEMWSLNFYNDWVAAYCKKHRSNSPTGDGLVCFIPTVNSDKGQFDKLLCNLNAHSHIPSGQIDLETGEDLGKRYIDLTDEEIIQELRLEFGPFYRNVINNIMLENQKLINVIGIPMNYVSGNPAVNLKEQLEAISDYYILQKFKLDVSDPKILNYINGFPYARILDDLTISNYIIDKFVENSGKTPEEIQREYPTGTALSKAAFDLFYGKYKGSITKGIHKTLTEYNKTHTRNPIQLAEQIHYTKGPRGLDVNHTLIAQWGRFGATPEEIQEARIQDLYQRTGLDDDIRVILGTEYSGSVETITPEQLAKIQLAENGEKLVDEITRAIYNRALHQAEGYFKARDLESAIKLLKNGCKIYLSGNKARNQEETEFLKNLDGGKWKTKSGMMAFTRVEDPNTHEMIPTNSIYTINLARLLGLNIEVHPMISKLNKMDYLTTQLYVCCVGGAHYVYKGGSGANVLEEEANRWLASNKRNVCYASTVHKFLNKVLNGAPTVYNYAIIDDIDAALYNIMGELKSHTPIDGGMLVNSFMPDLENASLGGEAAGTDKKHFATFYFEEYAAGGITKTAGFAATNERMRNSEDWRVLQENMSRRKWIKEFGNPDGDILEVLDITKDYDGNPINWQDRNVFYYRELPDGTIQFYRLAEVIKTENPNEYDIYEVPVDQYGVDLEAEPTLRTTVVIDNNWTLFNEVFGGFRSLGREVNHHGIENPNSPLTYSENSRKFMVDAINRIGYRKIKENSYSAVNKAGEEFVAYDAVVTKEDGHEDDLDDVWQPLKYSDIHFTPNIGAIKSTQMNVNPSDAMSERMDLNIMTVKMALLGIQLDKEHHADEAELSMPTLIITACANKGYTLNKATELYQALSTLTEISIEDCMEGIMDLLPEGELKGLLQAKIAEIIVDKLIYSRDDNEALHAVMEFLEEKRKAGNKLTPEEVKGQIPWSDTVVYNKIYSDLATHLTNLAVKLKISGSLAVICPTHHIERLYGNKRLSSLIELIPGGKGETMALYEYQLKIRTEGTEEELIFDRTRDAGKSKELLLNLASKINTLHIYHVEYINPLTGGLLPIETITVNYPQQYYYLKDELTKFREVSRESLNGAYASTALDGTINVVKSEEINVEDFYNYFEGSYKLEDGSIPITSIQKQKVLETLEKLGYTLGGLKELLGNDVRKIRMFLMFHELSHKKYKDAQKYPRSKDGKLKYLDPKAIEMESRATKEAWNKMLEISLDGENTEEYLREIAEVNGIYEAVCDIQLLDDGTTKITPLGRELSAYNVRFSANLDSDILPDSDIEAINNSEAEDLELDSTNKDGLQLQEVLNEDGTINWDNFVKIQKEYFEKLPDEKFSKGRYDLTNRPEHHGDADTYTLDHTRNVVAAATYLSSLPDNLRTPLLYATLLHDVGKPFRNGDHGLDSLSVINGIFGSFPDEKLVKLAVRYHMVQADSDTEVLADILATVEKYGEDPKKFVNLLLALKTCDIINGRTGSEIDQYSGKTVAETVNEEIGTLRQRFLNLVNYKENVASHREFCIYDLDSIRLLFEVINDVMPKSGPGIEDILQFGKNRLSSYKGISEYIESEPLLSQNKDMIDRIMRAKMLESYPEILEEYQKLRDKFVSLQKLAKEQPDNKELAVKRNDAYWAAKNFLTRNKKINPDSKASPEQAFIDSYKYAVKTFLRKQLQQDLFRLSLDYKGERKIMSLGKIFNISEESILPIAYELIMPKIYKTIFGLLEHDDLQAILADKNFFTKRALSKLKNSIADDNLYDYLLKRFSGEHMYILDSRNGIPEGLTPHPDFHVFTEEDGTYSRVDILGNQIYPLSSNRDRVMITSDGTEVIVTDRPEFFIESNIFHTATFSNSRINSDSLQLVLTNLRNSRSKNAQKFCKIFANRLGNVKNFSALKARNRSFDDLSPDLTEFESSGNVELDKLIAELYKEGREVHASFDKSLDIIAGRIPAQSQLSFMTQRVVAFGDADINAAYVSTFLLFILGSDLDIDTVNLIGAGFDRLGHYVLWSPHANIESAELIRASELLPFPTGHSTELTYDNSKDSFFVTYNDYFKQGGLFTIEKDPDTGDLLKNEAGVPVIGFDSMSPKAIKLLAEFIRKVNKLGLNLKGTVSENGTHQYSRELDEEIYSEGLRYNDLAVFTELGLKPSLLHDLLMQVLKIVDDHNLYIKRVGNRTKELMAKNLCYYQMYSIAADPSNLTENQDSIDNSTKVLKDKKEGAVVIAMSDEDRYDITSNNEKLSGPDPVTKSDSLQVGLTGKGGVSIGAKGVQGNSMILYALDAILNSDNSEDIKKRILLPVAKNYRGDPITRKTYINGLEVIIPLRGYKIDGKWRSSIANIHDKTYEESGQTLQTDQEIIAMLQSLQDFAKLTINAGTQNAAMLSVAVDNAKDLCLGKINAGPLLFGMYVYGITLGIDIVSLAKIMNSPQGKALSRALSGNIFTGEQGASSVALAIKFLEGENLTRYLTGYDFRIDKLGRYGAYNAAFEMTSDLRTADCASKVVHLALEEVYLANRTDKNLVPPRTFNDLVVELIKTNKLKDYLEIIQEPGSRFASMVLTIREDAAKTNSKYRTYPKGEEWLESVYQLIEWLEEYSDLSNQWKADKQKRSDLKILAGGAEEMRLLGTLLGSNKGVKSKVEDGQNFINTLETLIIKRKEALNMKVTSEDKIDYILFCTNPEYRELCILKYEDVKHSVNILLVVAVTPHIFSYLRASMIPHAGFMDASSRYRSVQAMLNDGAHNLVGVVTSLDKAAANKGLNNEVNAMMLMLWLSDTLKLFILPAGCLYFEEGTSEVKVAKDNIPIALWTLEGLATFKMYMETKIIPGILKKDTILRDNKFVKGLTPFSYSLTGTHATVSAYTLTGDMMAKPGTALDALVKEYQAAFKTIGNMRFPMRRFVKGGSTIGNMQDAFYLYAEYVFGGRKGPNSLMTLFDDGTSELLKEFRAAKAAMDQSRDFILTKEQQMRSMAPTGSIYNPRFKYYYGTDPELIGVNFYQNEEKTLTSLEKLDRAELNLGVSKAAPFNLKTESGKGELLALHFLYPLLTSREEVVQVAGLNITYNSKQFLSWEPSREFLGYYTDDAVGRENFERDREAVNAAIKAINNNMGVITTGVYNNSKITMEVKNLDIVRAAIEMALRKSRGEC